MKKNVLDWKKHKDAFFYNMGYRLKLRVSLAGIVTYELTIARQMYKDKAVYEVYVNDEIRGAWLGEEPDYQCPECLFMYGKQRSYSSIDIVHGRMMPGKRVFIMTYPYYPSFAAVKRQLLKVCNTIELIEE